LRTVRVVDVFELRELLLRLTAPELREDRAIEGLELRDVPLPAVLELRREAVAFLELRAAAVFPDDLRLREVEPELRDEPLLRDVPELRRERPSELRRETAAVREVRDAAVSLEAPVCLAFAEEVCWREPRCVLPAVREERNREEMEAWIPEELFDVLALCTGVPSDFRTLFEAVAFCEASLSRTIADCGSCISSEKSRI
jgi:hypothetical protein